MSEISKATDEDDSLCALRAAIRTRCWNSDRIRPFKQIKEEITIDHHNVLLRGTRIIIPTSLQQHVIQIAHEGHQGQAKTKALLREHVWFPDMEKAVKTELEHCLACQATLQPNPPEPIKSAPMPQSEDRFLWSTSNRTIHSCSY